MFRGQAGYGSNQVHSVTKREWSVGLQEHVFTLRGREDRKERVALSKDLRLANRKERGLS